MLKVNLSILFSILAFAASAQGKNFIDQPYIEVSGTADSLVVPNEIFIKIIISEKDGSDKASLEERESKMIAAFKTIGINTEEDLTTSDLLSNYRYYLFKQKDVSKSKEYIVKVKDAATASNVFIKLEDLRISNTSITELGHTKLEIIKNTCRTKAIKNARANAIALTKAIDQSVGSAIHIVDHDVILYDQEMPLNARLNERLSGVVVTGYGVQSKEKFEPAKISFKKIKVQKTVSVKFVLK